MSDQQKRKQVRYMTVFDILTVMAGIAGCSSAVQAGRTTAGSHPVIGWAIGLALGFGCFWILRLGFQYAARCLRLPDPKLRRVQLFAAGLLIVAAIGLIASSHLIASWALRLIGVDV